MEYFSSVIVCSCLHTPFLFAFFVQVMMDIFTDQAGPGLHYLLFDGEYLDLFFGDYRTTSPEEGFCQQHPQVGYKVPRRRPAVGSCGRRN